MRLELSKLLTSVPKVSGSVCELICVFLYEPHVHIQSCIFHVTLQADMLCAVFSVEIKSLCVNSRQ